MADAAEQLADVETQLDALQTGTPLTRLTVGSTDKTFERAESLHNVRSRLQFEQRGARVTHLSVESDFR